MIQIQVEKLRFMVEEMQLAHHLASNMRNQFYARTISRHTLVRAENFIEHARRLRRPLKDAGFKVQAFHSAKEAYASQFEEYFKVARHRLGAHVQDFDFGKRIDLWNDIEDVKLSYFVEGALEIYEELVKLQVPGVRPFITPALLSDMQVTSILQTLNRSLEARTSVEMAADPLASTRESTIGHFNSSPVHARAAQLALIHRWISMQGDLSQRLSAFPEITRLFKVRLITDIVSFCDCLVTRAVTPGALQSMDGLDKLLKAMGEFSGPVDNFVSVSKFSTILSTVRSVRDQIGAHLEIDETVPLASLLRTLNDFDFKLAMSLFERLREVFNQQCRAVPFLLMYPADGAQLHGMVAVPAMALVPFADSSEPVHTRAPEKLPLNEEDAYQSNLRLWLDGDKNQKETAQHFFMEAMSNSDVVEELIEKDRDGSIERNFSHKFRNVHLFILTILNEDLTDFDFAGILDLIVSCRNGYPYPLAEILVRHNHRDSNNRQFLTCRALGEIASVRHRCVTDFLALQCQSSLWLIRLEAVIAQYKLFLNREGLLRINHKGRTQQVDHAALVLSLISDMTQDQRAVCLIAIASIHTGPLASLTEKPFESDFKVLQVEIEKLLNPLLNNDDQHSSSRILNDLLQTNDYVGVCVHIALNLKGRDRHPLFSLLIESCCNGTIIAASHDQAIRHLVMCYLLKRDYKGALRLAEPLAVRNPAWIEVQILVFQILGEIPGKEAETIERATTIRSIYQLCSDQETLLSDVEANVRSRMRR